MEILGNYWRRRRLKRHSRTANRTGATDQKN